MTMRSEGQARPRREGVLSGGWELGLDKKPRRGLSAVIRCQLWEEALRG